LKVRFIINPKAGGLDKTAAITDAVREELSGFSGLFEIKVAAGSDSLKRLSEEAVRKGYDVVFACGGDGTVHHAAAPLVNTKTVLGLMPAGSGNALARTLGIPAGIRECVALLKSMRVREIDTGVVCGRCFFTTAGMGFEAHLSKRYAGGALSSSMRGLAPYFPLAVLEFFRYRCAQVNVKADGFSGSLKPLLLTAANTERFGGEAYIAPGAAVDDGLLDLCIVPCMNIFSALRLGSLLFSRKIEGFKRYTRVRTRAAEITREGTFSVQADGEAFDWSGPVEISIKPKSLRILVSS